MSRNIPFTTQSNADASKCFKRQKRGAKKIFVSDIRKMFAKQMSKVQLHRRKLQSKVRKNLEVGAQRWKHENFNI